jgi:hypothetical protein
VEVTFFGGKKRSHAHAAFYSERGFFDRFRRSKCPWQEEAVMANRKRILWISIAVILIAAAMFGVYYATRPQAQQGDKAIALKVVGADGGVLVEENYRTDATTLGELLDEKSLAAFEDSAYGRYIVGVNGVRADESAQQWWHIGHNGEDAMTGADDLALADGDAIVLTLKTGY